VRLVGEGIEPGVFPLAKALSVASQAAKGKSLVILLIIGY
jgi:hypothetical protein